MRVCAVRASEASSITNQGWQLLRVVAPCFAVSILLQTSYPLRSRADAQYLAALARRGASADCLRVADVCRNWG